MTAIRFLDPNSGVETQPLDTIDECSDTDSSVSSLLDTTMQGEGEPKNDFDHLLSDITHIITCLYRFSMALQNPAPKDRLHKYKGIKVSHFAPYDTLYARDKFPHAPQYLQERLAKEIGRRRQLVKYYEQHHTKIKGKSEPVCEEMANRAIRQDTTIIKELAGTIEGVCGIKSLALVHSSSGRPPTVSTALNSHTTLSTFVDRAPGANHDTLGIVDTESEAGQSQTSFASSASGLGRLRIPCPPVAPAGAPFECPYCFSIIAPNTFHAWMYVYSLIVDSLASF